MLSRRTMVSAWMRLSRSSVIAYSVYPTQNEVEITVDEGEFDRVMTGEALEHCIERLTCALAELRAAQR